METDQTENQPSTGIAIDDDGRGVEEATLGPEKRNPLRLVATAGVLGALFLLVPGSRSLVATTVVLLLIVAFHEGGHLLAARRTGVDADVFSVGVGPVLWSRRFGPTRYQLAALPLGGYVKIVGMSTEEPIAPAREPRTYRKASAPRRATIAVAGPAANMLLAVLLAGAAHTFYGTPQPSVPIVAEITNPSPAAAAGIGQGDRIVSIDGHVTETVVQLREVLTQVGERRVPLVVTNPAGQTRTVEATPLLIDGAYRLGFVGTEQPNAKTNPAIGLGRGAADTWEMTENFVGNIAAVPGILWGTTAGALTEEAPAPENRGASPIAIADAGAAAKEAGGFSVLMFGALLSAMLGLFNLLPILPLDGGRIALVGFEAVASRVRGRTVLVPDRITNPIGIFVFGVLIVVSIAALKNDIVSPLR